MTNYPLAGGSIWLNEHGPQQQAVKIDLYPGTTTTLDFTAQTQPGPNADMVVQFIPTGTGVVRIDGLAADAKIRLGASGSQTDVITLSSGTVTYAAGTMGGQILAVAGTAAAPGISFSGDADTGLFHGAANRMSVATNGAEVVRFSTTGVSGPSGGLLVVDAGATVTAGGLGITAGGLAVGTLVSANIGAYVVSSLSGNANQYGVYSSPTFSTAATGLNVGYYSILAIPDQSYTATTVAGVYVDTASKGAGATVANLYGAYINNQTATTSTLSFGMFIGNVSGSSGNNYGLYVKRASGTGANTIVSEGKVAINEAAVAGGESALVITPGTHTAVTAEVTDVSVAAHTMTATGAITLNRSTRVASTTISAATAQTITTAANVAIDSIVQPTGAGPATITNSFGLMLGDTLTSMAITAGSSATTITTAAGLYIANAPATTGNTTITKGAALLINAGSVVLNVGGIAQGATTGFVYIPVIATGAPNGTPAAWAGTVPMAFLDNAGGGGFKLYIYSVSGSAWKSATVA